MFLFKKTDKQGRLSLGNDLFLESGLSSGKVAICMKSDTTFVLRNPENVHNERIIGYRNIDSKNRIILGKDFDSAFSYYLIYLYNGELTIEGFK